MSAVAMQSTAPSVGRRCDPGASSADRNASTHGPARRKVRKGTKSCWECRRRKMKCVYAPLSTGTVCCGCQRRGSECVSQKYVGAASPSPLDQPAVNASAASTESDVSDSARRVARTPTSLGITPPDSPRPVCTAPHRCVIAEQPNSFIYLQKTATVSEIGNGSCTDHGDPQGSQSVYAFDTNRGVLSQLLHSSLPLRADLAKICDERHRLPVPVLAHEILTLPYATLEKDGLPTAESLLETPAPDAHPALIAQHMLQIAIFLQHLSRHSGGLEGLKEPSETARVRMANLAFSLVTVNEELVGSIEGLACVMMESMYHVNAGNLRKSWAAGRRAIGIAQLMGLDRPEFPAQKFTLDPRARYDARFMWFRILFLDAQLSLMLGLPRSLPDRHLMGSDRSADDTDTGYMERLHYMMASRILERKESHSYSHRLELTATLDKKLKKAAESVPSRWWSAPKLEHVASTSSHGLFWETRRLFAQILHYSLLNQLHLPYMLCMPPTDGQHKCHYSRMTCINASREIISRFITLRAFDQIAYSWNCRIVDFLALMAAMTLLLAHLHDTGDTFSQDLLAHQYQADRASIEQVQEHMGRVNQINCDALSGQSANVLQRLLAIEADAQRHPSTPRRQITVHEPLTETSSPTRSPHHEANTVFHVPYFGVLKVHDVAISYVSPQNEQNASQYARGFMGANTHSMATGCLTPSTSSNVTVDTCNDMAVPLLSAKDFCHGVVSPQKEQMYDILATGEDWAFQGVDMNFFDNLIGVESQQDEPTAHVDPSSLAPDRWCASST
ncbi:Zn2/Cys6 DNA-binding protein [Teratosphaeria destructans]|uniref:Zn2/Cys6 DNA-binding protein n=1 Tax=Teratosphaeria destructans TaxID=418781 RepID=A0A9W7SZI1_9PEZI|nr:Zn2/Cys6 DNA-binding protein [Teratosphaeria destructans]